MDTESLDTLIRSKARKQLEKDIKAAALYFKRVLGVEFCGDTVKVKAIDINNYVRVAISRTIDNFVAEAVKNQAPKLEDAAVQKFLDQHESMQDQIDELNNG